MKPCHHINIDPRCGLCHLYQNSNYYRQLWSRQRAAVRTRTSQHVIQHRPACPPCLKGDSNVIRTRSWAYGITGIPQRMSSLLIRTIRSLAAAGFDRPRLFIDGASPQHEEMLRGHKLGLDITFREQALNAYGNWVMALAELYIREPAMERYAIFQDDIACCRNLRAYLDRVKYLPGYWNLYCSADGHGKGHQSNFQLANGRRGFIESNQQGKGALALVFDREAVTTLLGHRHIVLRPQAASDRRFRALDGAVVSALSDMHSGPKGWREYVHAPSLIQHTGMDSTLGNAHGKLSPNFVGEDFDALELLPRVPL